MQFRLNRRNLIRRAGILSAAGLGPLVIGCDRIQPDRPNVKFRVMGNSMAPTFVGTHTELRCDRCGIAVRVPSEPVRVPSEHAADGDAVSIPAETTAEFTAWTCWHCGHGNRSPTPPTRPGDVVEIIDAVDRPGTITTPNLAASNLAELALGDVVAIRWGNRTRLKRIAGLPGDTITAEGLWLHNDHVPVHRRFSPHQQATVPVDVDALRADSRWRPSPTSGDSVPVLPRWTRRQNQWQSPAADDARGRRIDPQWLVYHHVNVHDHADASPVYDDWPSNIDLARRLFPARDLRLSLTLVAPGPRKIETAVWSTAGVWRQTMQADLFDRMQHSSGLGTLVQPTIDHPVPVSVDAPLAIRVIDGPCRISGIRVDRCVEYRLRPHDDATVYPLKIDDGECFVVGDNVPVSIDSRDAGLIPVDQIRGLIRGVGMTR